MTRKPALGFAIGYGLVRLYWTLGGRWGYTACDRAGPPLPDGCAAATADLPFWSGWGAVALCGVLVALVFAPRAGLWAAGAGLLLLAFPAHLLFELPAAAFGRATDWRDLGHRLVLVAGAVLFCAAAYSPPDRPRSTLARPVPAWARRWTYAACAVPVLGFSLPHALWFAGLPVGIPREMLAEAVRDVGVGTALTLTMAPLGGAVLTLGLARPWGQVFPRWLGGRPVPRLLALAPSGVLAVALAGYGVLGVGMIAGALGAGTTTWHELGAGWAVVLTEVVFLGWGVALAGAAWGYHRSTGPTP